MLQYLGMLAKVFKALDEWVIKANKECEAGGLPTYPPCQIRVFGQTALMEAELGIPLVATNDVDVFADYQHGVKMAFAQILQKHQKVIDPVGHEAWMPDETEWLDVYTGRFIVGKRAQPEYVLISKALKARNKNRNLLIEYLASGPSELFMDLAAKYEINMGDLL